MILNKFCAPTANVITPPLSSATNATAFFIYVYCIMTYRNLIKCIRFLKIGVCCFSFTLATNEVKSLRILIKMGSNWYPILIVACLSRLGVAQEPLIFQTSNNPLDSTALTTPRPIFSASSNLVLVNNVRIPGAITPFVSAPAPNQEFLNCFGSCPTTSQYSPICGSNMQQYMNEQKFNCARFCGADIQIVRRGSCEGLFAMTRG